MGLITLIFSVTDPTPERDKSLDPGRESGSPVPDMDWRRMRLSLHSPPLNKPIAPVRVSAKPWNQTLVAQLQLFHCSKM